MRTTGALAAVLVTLCLASAGCDSSGERGPGAEPAATSDCSTASPAPSQSVVPAPTALPTYAPDARIPLAPQTAPEDFAGDDEHFLAVTRGLLIALDEEAPAADPRLVTVGREVCSLLSGGGAVAAKLDFYAGQRSMSEDGWTAVIGAAIQTYCPDLGPGYFADRDGPLPMTSAEQADLVRYVVRAGVGDDADVPDDQILRLSRKVCGLLDSSPDRLPNLVGEGTGRNTAVVVFAVVLAYCPEHQAALGQLLASSA